MITITKAKEKQIKTAFKNKKSNARGRGIDLDLTFNQFARLYLQTHCAYTGVEFNDEHRTSLTIERVDPSKGYTATNCVAVTSIANSIADSIEREDFRLKASDVYIYKKIAKLSLEDKIAKVKELFPEQNLWDGAECYDIPKPYAIVTKVEEEKTEEMTDDTATEENVTESVTEAPTTQVHHSDLDLAQSYIVFVKSWLQNDDSCTLSFGKYKRLLARKTCEITRMPIVGGGRFIKIDDNLPLSDDNVKFVSAKTRQVIATLKNLTPNQAQKILQFKDLL
ncbi:postulated decoy protein [Pseudoalteromonas phage J2-1_QLiu-2017]|nr:postulated decoy protein [Pseudoalteromonas phage J2-1_QLiu-2017]